MNKECIRSNRVGSCDTYYSEVSIQSKKRSTAKVVVDCCFLADDDVDSPRRSVLQHRAECLLSIPPTIGLIACRHEPARK